MNGNVTSTGGKTFSYDAENHLIAMGSTVALEYDGDGNRVAKAVNGVTTQYLVDDLNPTGYPQVVDELTNGAVTATYTYGFQRISEDRVNGGVITPSWYMYDGLGNVRQLTNSNNQVTDSYEYDAFGNLLNKTGSTTNPYLYRGEYYDSDLGLYYLRARYYNPITGRFMSRDPNDPQFGISPRRPINPTEFHKYLYAGGDPINRVDPSGRDELLDAAFEMAIHSIETIRFSNEIRECLIEAFQGAASSLSAVISGDSGVQTGQDLSPSLVECGFGALKGLLGPIAGSAF